MGTVDAYDTSNNTYRIRFDREALGKDYYIDGQNTQLICFEKMPTAYLMRGQTLF